MKFLIIVPLFLMFSGSAHAWLLFEPYIGYHRGQHQGSRLQGIGLGARVGADLGSVFIAGDIVQADLQQGSFSSVKYTDTAVVLGAEVQSYRIWYGMIVSTQFSYTSGGSTTVYKGAGTKIGLGAKVGNKTFLNIEMKTYDYTENSVAGVTSAISEIATLGLLALSWVY
jgi:hypothetical protein